MLSRVRLFLTAMLAALAISSASASADPFSFSPGGSFSTESLGPLIVDAGGVDIECEVTLAGSFNAGTIETTDGTTFGALNRGTSGCGEITMLGPSAEAPWELKYRSVTGEMPDAVTDVSFRIANVSFEGTFAGIRCLYRGDVEASASLPPATEAPQPYGLEQITLTGNTIRKFSGSAFCPSVATVEGTLALNAAQQVAVHGATWRPRNPYDFGDREKDRTFTVEIELINGNVADITVRQLTIGQPDIFRIAGIAVNEIIDRGQTKRIRLSFTPRALQTYNASFHIISTSSRQYVLNIRGRGI